MYEIWIIILFPYEGQLVNSYDKSVVDTRYLSRIFVFNQLKTHANKPAVIKMANSRETTTLNYSPRVSLQVIISDYYSLHKNTKNKIKVHMLCTR